MARTELVPAGRSELWLRVVSAAVLVPLGLVLVWFGGLAFAVFVVLVSGFAAWEWGRLTDGKQFAAGFWIPAVTVLAAVWLLKIYGPAPAFGAILAGVVAAYAAGCAGRRGRLSEFLAAAGPLYIALPAIALVAIRGDEADSIVASSQIGVIALAFVFLAVWASDIGGYVVGRSIGGPKLAPRISPGKTWSGAIGGIAAAALCGTLVAGIADGGTWGMLASVAVLLSIAAQIGDLAESALKRRAGAKDSSRLIPGHGGVLDRLDGLMFASVAGLLIGVAREGFASPARGLFIW